MSNIELIHGSCRIILIMILTLNYALLDRVK